jgi:hypothetical protein
MKIITLFLLTTSTLIAGCNPTPINNNYFEGKITYEINYVPKTKNADTAFLNMLTPSKAEMYYKEGNFYEKFEGGLIREEYYRKNENKDYTLQDSNDTLYWIDCGKEGAGLQKTEVNPAKKKILGIMCDELVLHYNYKRVKFYFNPDTLKINPDWYAKFTFQNKNIQMQMMKSLYLGFEMEYPDFTIVWTITNIEPQKINDKLLLIPSNKILKQDN